MTPSSSSLTECKPNDRIYSDFNLNCFNGWIQQPANRLPLSQSETLVSGIYLVTIPMDVSLPSQDLINELAAWEAASDEDFLNFEQGL